MTAPSAALLRRCVLPGLLAAVLLPGTVVLGQGAGAPPAGAGNADVVTIEREPLRLIEPQRYQVTLTLKPSRVVEIGPTTDGVVAAILAKPGDEVDSKSEVARLDDREQQILVKQAQAQYRAGEIELRRAKAGSDSDLTDLAQAKLDAVQAGLELATLRLERTHLRVPFAGTVLRVNAGTGELVRAGTPILMFGDMTQMRVELPVDRKSVKAGDRFEFRVEDRTVSGKVESILPLAEEFEPLRDIVNSVASAVIVLDNADKTYKAGQTVYAPLIPRHAVTEVATAAIANGEGGVRQVQVVREGTVRNVTVELLAAIGETRAYISGPFQEGDELVVSASQPLADGTRVAPLTSAATPAAARPAGGRPQAQPGRPANAGF
ncbi:MAG: efflux RND transporter periplasmic adaptor subunit [Planctomycetaceae bacterium]|nr:efflux RND transporter periplasmic adaptor subunit [Planctomycetaceae bacterium]